MKFKIEFYENVQGRCPVQDFLEDLKDTAPDDFAIILAGLNKLKLREYHRPPLSKPIGEGLYELRHVGKLNTRIFYFFAHSKRIVLVSPHYHKPSSRDRIDGLATGQPQGLVAEAYLNGTSQVARPEDARRDVQICGRSRLFVNNEGYAMEF